jgi:hypothetical protein
MLYSSSVLSLTDPLRHIDEADRSSKCARRSRSDAQPPSIKA